jgi:predicted Zn-dependent peptidase
MTSLVQKTTLNNCVRVLTEHMPGIRSVSVGVICDVGSKDEQPLERGYAHLIEHMLFQGTGSRSSQAIAEMMEIGGGAMGAFTARDYTVYHATMLDEYLPFALDVLGDMVSSSLLAEDAIARQRSVILNEIAGLDDPLKQANDVLKANLWPDHPLGFPTVGLESTIKAATRESLLDFMARHYVARKVIVVAAGNVRHDTFAAEVWDAFWKLPSDETTTQSRPAPVPSSGRLIGTQRDLRQVYFSLAWPAPSYSSPDRYAWHIMCALLGGGPTSSLFQKLREEKGLAYHIESSYQAYGDAGALVVDGATMPETLVPVIAGILLELMRLGSQDIDQDRYHHTVQSLVSQHLVSGDSAYVRMSRLGLQELYFQEPVLSEEVSRGLKTQSPETVRTLALQLFSGSLPTIALVGPVTDSLLAQVEAMLSDFGHVDRVGTVGAGSLVLPQVA